MVWSWKTVCAAARREGLEAALRVGEGQAHDGAGDRVETAAEELAVERLANGLARALKPAGADGDVGAVGDGGEEAFGFFHGRGEIGVSEHDDLAEGLQQAVAHAVALAVVAGILEAAGLLGRWRQTREPCRRSRSREPSLTTTTSADQPRLRMQATTDSRAPRMRAASLYAGITMLYCG